MYTMGLGGGDPSQSCKSHQDFSDADNDVITGGGGKTTGYTNPELEALSDALDAVTSLDDTRPICAAMEGNITHNLPHFVIWTIPIVEAVHS